MTVSTTSAASTEPTASASSASTAVEPMNLKIPLTGVVALLLQGFMVVGAHGSTTFNLTASSDLFQLRALLPLTAKP